MGKVEVKFTKRYGNQFCGEIEKLPVFISCYTGTFERFKRSVRVALERDLEWRRQDGDKLDPVFDGKYELVFVKC